jgi:hypothetical protein
MSHPQRDPTPPVSGNGEKATDPSLAGASKPAGADAVSPSGVRRGCNGVHFLGFERAELVATPSTASQAMWR